MGGLGIRLIGGALSGLGDGMLEQAKANRALMLEQLKRSQELADKQTEYAHQDQRQKDQQTFQAGESDKTRAAEDTRQAAGFTQADKIQGRTIDAEGKRQGIMIGAENTRAANTISAENTRSANELADKQKARDDNAKLSPATRLIQEHNAGLIDDANFADQMKKLNALPRTAAGAGYSGAKKYVYDLWMANHPGDTEGAEQAMLGHKELTDADLVIQAKRLAIGEANSFATPQTISKLEADNLKALKSAREETRKGTAAASKTAGPRLPASPLRRDGGTSSAPAPQSADAPPLSKGVMSNGMIPGSEPTLDPAKAGDNWGTFQISQDGIEKHYVLPTKLGDKPPSGDGIEMGDAVKRFLKTKQHYGAFDSDETADAFMNKGAGGGTQQPQQNAPARTPPANLLKAGRRQHVTAPDGTDMGYWTLGANGQPQQVQ